MDLHGCEARLRAAIPQPAAAAGTPAPDRAVELQRAARIIAGRDLGHVLQPDHLCLLPAYTGVTIRRSAVAQLARAIAAPAPDRAGSCHDTGMPYLEGERHAPG